jgi:hypothetical protein
MLGGAEILIPARIDRSLHRTTTGLLSGAQFD